MCAIFGWFGADTSENLRGMAATMQHRGPDGEGFLHTSEVAIGMTRLAIVDLENGQQPFHSNDQSISVVCNGEIYNFAELKTQLLELGHTFQTNCDCEILPAAYQQWGIDFLNKLNGMFAIAIYDHSQNQLTLARDRFGQKPLYYASHNGNIYFSSEIRGLHKIGIPKAINHSAIPSYLSLRYVPEPETMFQDIKILPVGSFLTIENEVTIKCKKWYQIPVSKTDYPDATTELHDITRLAIHSALISDVPIALHLSAGIDSSVLLAEIKKTDTPIQCITAGFGAKSDEVNEAAALCKKYTLAHTVVELCADDIRSLPDVISQMELPVGDALILAFDRLAEATAEAGCKVAIGGEGIDEAFAGYSFHKFMMLGEKLGSVGRAIAVRGLALTPEYILNKLSAFPANLGKSGRLKIQNYLHSYNYLTDYEKGVNLRTLFSQSEINQLAVVKNKKITLPELTLSKGDLLESHLKHQFESWMQDWAIIRQERNTMAHSVEYRMPFLDHRLIEFAFSLENKQKLNGRAGKHIWRKMAAKYYPETQHKRTKQPFFFPTEEPAYFKEITTLLNSTIGSEKFHQRRMFDMEQLKQLRETAERTREFLPIKQLLSIAILELWMQEHDL